MKGLDWINSFINGKEKLTVLNFYNSDNTDKKEAEIEVDSV